MAEAIESGSGLSWVSTSAERRPLASLSSRVTLSRAGSSLRTTGASGSAVSTSMPGLPLGVGAIGVNLISQRFEQPDGFSVALGEGCFKHRHAVLEPGIPHQAPERRDANHTLADLLMPIDPATERLLAVVEV